ncbi:MAG TPA: hypothetical protein DCY12_03990 [Candidatus Atribacteria bacterium]|nr:hypothetical protein [Candidatus Atribacteria bacterium]
MNKITDDEVKQLHKDFSVLIGIDIDWISIPADALGGFEPSQIAVITNTLLDGLLPQIVLLGLEPEHLKTLKALGLKKSPGDIGQRESYPDYVHSSGKRVELKGLFVDNPKLKLKRPPTPREPSARVKENITMDVIRPKDDVLLLAAVELQEIEGQCSPVIIDIAVFPMIDIIIARDKRLIDTGGKWFGKVPKVVKKKSMKKYESGQPLSDSDYEKDTNFGKLKRIPYPPLEAYLKKHKICLKKINN